MRDVDVSPDGSYFVVVTTGAYRAGSLCDAAARWETAVTGPSQQPTWVDDTGSDTERIARYEHHGRIGFMPLARSVEVPCSRVGTLPGDLFRLGLDRAMSRSPFTAATAGPATVVSGPAVDGRSWQSGPDRVPVSCAPPRPCSSRDRAAVS
jgi:hypothetical protein